MKPVPMKEIGKILREVMQTACDNGANPVSMPDEYVAVAHFLCYAEEYTTAVCDSILTNSTFRRKL